MAVKKCEKGKCWVSYSACGNLKLVVNNTETVLPETPISFSINNRRHLGNKYKLNKLSKVGQVCPTCGLRRFLQRRMRGTRFFCQLHLPLQIFMT